jgi:2-polyprenyl-3-methyl-5-hydroxy-6-metoxy-1,4-benzoquinol methylase
MSTSSLQELSNCLVQDVRTSWDEAASPWTVFVRDDFDVHRLRGHGRALIDVCGDVTGLRALDLGCGEGWCCRELARRGADVVGVDVSAVMIASARSHPPEGARIDYRVMDGVDIGRELSTSQFDLATACMSLQDMPDPGAVLRATRQVLAPQGRLVCSVPHPFTHMMGGRRCVREPADGRLRMTVGGYFDRAKAFLVPWAPARVGASWKTIRWSRSLEDYWRLFRESGFTMSDMLEPHPDADDLRLSPTLLDSAEIPKSLLLVAQPDNR